MSEPQLIAALAEVCAQVREDATMDFLDIQFAFPREIRPRTVKTIERFEKGDTWPNDPQATVSAYSGATGIPAIELWQSAIDRWQAAQEKAEGSQQQPGRDTEAEASSLRKSSAAGASGASGESHRPRKPGGRK